MGFGELVLLLIIVVVVFGATKLPDLSNGLGDMTKRYQQQQQIPRLRLLLRLTSPRRWTVLDWLLAISASVAVAAVIANALLLRR